jgi:hypothetical protein
MSNGEGYNQQAARAAVWNSAEGILQGELDPELTHSKAFEDSCDLLMAGEFGTILAEMQQTYDQVEASMATWANDGGAPVAQRAPHFSEDWPVPHASPSPSHEIVGRLKNVAGATMTLGIGSLIWYLHQRRKG